MFFIQFEATPRRDALINAHIDETIAGAIVNCWIDRPILADAIEAAQASIREAGWIVDDPDDAYPVDETTYPPGEPGREYYLQAIEDREVLVFHCFPDAEEDDDDDESAEDG